MRVVHYGQSCVLIETGSARLLLDPGVFSNGFETLTDLDAVLVTHQHPDHLDVERLPALLAANPNATLITDPGTEKWAREAGFSPSTARPGAAFEIAGAAINVVGGQHAVIHPEFPVVRNSGYVIDHGAFYHPGDSLFVPEQAIDVLGLPTGAPWLKGSEAVDFMRMVHPRVAVPIHQAVLATPDVWYGHFRTLAPEGTTVTVLPATEAVTP